MLQYAKALLAGAITFAGSMATGYAEEPLTQAELWLAISFGLGAVGAVLGVPNKGYVKVQELERLNRDLAE